MKNETLLDKACSNFNLAKDILSKLAHDEYYLNFIAYHLQQSTEVALKRVHEVNGVKFEKTRNIGDLLSILSKMEPPILFPYLKRWKDTVTLWESQTRYVKNFMLELEDIEEYIPLLERLLDDCKEMSLEYTNNPIEQLRGLNNKI